MSVEENKAAARRWNEEIVTGKRLDAFDEVLDKNYAVRSGTQRPWSPTIQGLEQVKEYFGGVLREHPTWQVVVDDIIGEGDKVAVRKTFFEKGKPISNVIAFYGFSDGKIIDDWYCSRHLDE